MKPFRNVFANKIDYLVALVYIVVLVAVFSSNPSSLIYLSIDEMTFIEWATVIVSTVCITLLPGYLFLCTFFKHMNAELKIVLSFFISIFFGSIVGVINPGIYSLAVYLIPVILFGISQAYSKFRNKSSQYIIPKFEFSRNIVFMLILVLIVVTFCYFAFFQNIGLRGDLWRVFSDSIYINSHGLANYATYYPYFLLSFYSSIYYVSSINLIVVFLLIVSESLIFMTLAFKNVVQKITDNSNIAFIASLIFILFSGLDWIYALPKLLSNDLYSDLYTVGTTHMGGIIYQPWSYGFDHTLSVVGLGASFLVIALILDKKTCGIRKYSLISTLTFIAYASYVQEAFLLIYCFFIIFSLRELNKRIMLKESLSLLIGIALVFLYSSLSSSLVEYYQGFTFLWAHVLFIGAYSAFLFFQKYRKLPLHMIWQKLSIHFNRKLKIGFGILILILYLTGLLIEVSFIADLPTWPFWNYFPLYHYPFAFGIAGFLVIGLVLSHLFGLHRFSTVETLSISVLLLSVFMAEAFGWLQIGRPGGMISWIFAFVSIISAIFIFKLLIYKQFKTGKFKSILAIMICLLFVFGSFSTILGVYFTNQRPGPYFDPGTSISLSESDIALLDFLYSKSSIEIFSIVSDNPNVNQIASLAGVHVLSAETNNLFLTSNNPVTITQIKNDQTIKYVILNSNSLNSDSSTNYGYISYLLNESQTVRFENYDLFELPYLPQISPNSDIGIVYDTKGQGATFYQAASALAQSNFSYTTYNPLDPAQLTANTLILMSDIGEINWTLPEFDLHIVGGNVDNSSNSLIFKADTLEGNHDLILSGLNVTVKDFHYISVSGRSLDSELWIYVHSSISGWQYAYIGNLELGKNFVVNLFNYTSFFDGDYGNQTILQDSLRYNDLIDQILFRVNAPKASFIINSVMIGEHANMGSINYSDWVRNGGSLVLPSMYVCRAPDDIFSLPGNDVGSGITLIPFGNGSIVILPNNVPFDQLNALFESGQIPVRNQSTEAEVTPPILRGSPEQPNELSFSNITVTGDIILKSQGGYFIGDSLDGSLVAHKGVEYLKVTSLTVVNSSGGQYVQFRLDEDAQVVYSSGEKMSLPPNSTLVLKSPVMQINGTLKLEGCTSFSLADKETPYMRGSDVNIEGFSIIEFVNQDFNFMHAKMPLNNGKITSSVDTIYVGHAPSTLYSSLPWGLSEMAIPIALSIIFALIISLVMYRYPRYALKTQS